ncbi:MAG: hypothetical protein ABIN61_02345 [candidate division WOR-3 bacterium]
MLKSNKFLSGFIKRSEIKNRPSILRKLPLNREVREKNKLARKEAIINKLRGKRKELFGCFFLYK